MSKQNARTAIFLGLIGVAMITRILPHAPNFTAVGAAAIFGGYMFKESWKAFLAPLLAMFISDLFINNVIYAQFTDGFMWFTGGFAFIYGAIALSTLLARTNKYGDNRLLNIASSAVGSAVIFYLLTNLGVWLGSPMYAPNFLGLMQSYAAGLPFLLNSLTSTLLYSAVMFGAVYAYQGSFKLARA